MIAVEEMENMEPICPHCEKKINKIFTQRLQTTFGIKFIYFCSYCKKVLGVSHRKGFWMG